MAERDAKKVAGALTPKQRGVLLKFTENWQAGPDLSSYMLANITPFEVKELLERRFMDQGPAEYSSVKEALQVRLRACWHFRLTPLGLSVRDHLRGEQ